MRALRRGTGTDEVDADASDSGLIEGLFCSSAVATADATASGVVNGDEEECNDGEVRKSGGV